MPLTGLSTSHLGKTELRESISGSTGQGGVLLQRLQMHIEQDRVIFQRLHVPCRRVNPSLNYHNAALSAARKHGVQGDWCRIAAELCRNMVD